MEITVTYTLTDAQVARLEKLAYLSPEALFRSLMLTGSTHEIDQRLEFAEKCVRAVPQEEGS